ncbi:MAG: hypothetical protein VX252_08095 [Myxococcota bacterium]|nr:hypothetical protein [Myxococcota bacterium]
MVFSWRLFLIGALLGAGLIALLGYLSSPQETEVFQAGNSPVEIEVVAERVVPIAPSARLAAERAKAEERDREDSGRPLPRRPRPKEPISELEDRARERRSFPGESPSSE